MAGCWERRAAFRVRRTNTQRSKDCFRKSPSRGPTRLQNYRKHRKLQETTENWEAMEACTDCPSHGSVVAVQSQGNVLHSRYTPLISGRCARACARARARAKKAKCCSFVFVSPQIIFSTRTAAFPIKKTNLKKGAASAGQMLR